MARLLSRSPDPTLPTPDAPDVPMIGGSNELRSFRSRSFPNIAIAYSERVSSQNAAHALRPTGRVGF
jgi:hypothetical protein